jgi:hypothetical protein
MEAWGHDGGRRLKEYDVYYRKSLPKYNKREKLLPPLVGCGWFLYHFCVVIFEQK